MPFLLTACCCSTAQQSLLLMTSMSASETPHCHWAECTRESTHFHCCHGYRLCYLLRNPTLSGLHHTHILDTAYSYGYYWLPHSSTVLRLQLLTLLRLVVEKQLLPPPLATGELEYDAAAVNWCPRPSNIFQIQDFFLANTCHLSKNLPATIYHPHISYQYQTYCCHDS